jgi:cell division protein FtsW
MEYLYLRFLHLGLGVAVFVLLSRVRYTRWRRYAPFLYFATLLCLALVLIPGIGTQVGGARRWLDLGPLSFQPAEIGKLAAVLALSSAVSRVRPGSGLPVRALMAVGLLFVLVLVEPDFGTSVVLLAGVAGVLWASEVRTADLILSGLCTLVILVVVMLLEPYRRERMMTFLDPYSVADGPGYQVVQAMVAIKSGSLFGTGAGGGGQAATVPEIGTDMIFALIGEEFGLLGMVAVIAAFGFLIAAGFKIALAAPTVLGRCIAAGLTTMISVQTIFNIGAAMVVLPLAGMTLPFISYGGSSLVVCFAAVGILYGISEDSERAREAIPRRNARRLAAEERAGRDSGGRYGGTRDPRAVRGG